MTISLDVLLASQSTENVSMHSLSISNEAPSIEMTRIEVLRRHWLTAYRNTSAAFASSVRAGSCSEFEAPIFAVFHLFYLFPPQSSRSTFSSVSTADPHRYCIDTERQRDP